MIDNSYSDERTRRLRASIGSLGKVSVILRGNRENRVNKRPERVFLRYDRRIWKEGKDIWFTRNAYQICQDSELLFLQGFRRNVVKKERVISRSKGRVVTQPITTEKNTERIEYDLSNGFLTTIKPSAKCPAH